MATTAATRRGVSVGLGTRAFLEEVRKRTLPELPPSLGKPRSRVVFSSLQVHFGEPLLHYEVWPVRKTRRIELGLHVEGPREWSRAVAAGLASGFTVAANNHAGDAEQLRVLLGDNSRLRVGGLDCLLVPSAPYPAPAPSRRLLGVASQCRSGGTDHRRRAGSPAAGTRPGPLARSWRGYGAAFSPPAGACAQVVADRGCPGP